MSANRPPEALDIVWPRLIAIADEMATTMFRTAFSHDVVEVHDMSTGLYDDRGCLIGQTWLGATGHTGVMPVYGQNLLHYFPPETVRPGDVFICNDPWICNGQTADVFITTPAFRGGRLIGFSINSVHHVDIGGRKGSGLSEEVYEEGLIIPPLKLYDDGEPNEQLFAILRRNVRFAEKMIGDLRAQVAAGWAGSRELERLAAEFGLDSLRAHADEIMRRTEAGMRAGIAALPDGEYHEELEMEVDGITQPQTLAVTVRIEGSDVHADFTGTSPQVRRPVNCPINYTRAYVALPLKLVCDPILPNNQGTYEPLHLSVPEGTLLNPTYPAACFWRLSAGMLVSELMFRVLSRIAPDRVPADSGSMPTWQFYVNGVRPDGEAFALHQHAFGGMGGRPGDDGLASVSFPYNVRDVSIEWSEMETPVLYEARELIPDSGGAGEYRGGLGQELILQAYPGRVKEGEPLVLSGSAGRMRFPPRGLGGGADGSYGAIEVNGKGIAPSSSPNVTFHQGDVVCLRLPGGGGHGDPARRRRERIEADLKAGYVTREGAQRDYGYETPGARPARAPHLLAGLHASAALPCAAWKCRIRSGAACGPILPDFAMCSTAQLLKARRASGRSPIVSVMHLTCATVAAGGSAQAAARRWAYCRHGATLRCLRPDITAPGDTARECSRRQWRRHTMCRARWGRCASLRWCGSRPTRNAGSGTP